MRFSAETTSDGVTERLFTLGDVPGVVWAAEGGRGRGRWCARARGRPSQDRPAAGRPRPPLRDAVRVRGGGHRRARVGRRPVPAAYGPYNAEIEELSAAGKPLGDVFARRGVITAALAVPEWQAAIDALAALDWVGPGPVGYWGVSLGTAIGLPLVAAEPRVTAAVLGLMGHDTLAEAAARITVPVQFHLQWDDEIVPRDSGLALFDAIGSAEKTLHANPGPHAAVPPFEIDSTERFFLRHLLA